MNDRQRNTLTAITSLVLVVAWWYYVVNYYFPVV